MNEALRNLFVNRLVESIRVIAPGPRFERFGGVFLNHYLGVPLSHHGLNALGHPVGGAVDTVADVGDYTAEYSAEKSYFDGRMPKLWGDVRHAFQQHPDAAHIFLLSSQSAPTTRKDALVRVAGRCQRKHGKQVHLYDGRRIAETIVDHLLLSDVATEQLA